MKLNDKVYFDKESDIYWIVYKAGEESFYKEYAPGFIVEFNDKSEVIGIEIQNWSRLISQDISSHRTEDSYASAKISSVGDYNRLDYLNYKVN